MPLDQTYLRVSDGTTDASLMTVQADRSIGSTILEVNTIVGIPEKFIATSGSVNAQGFIDPDTATNFYGHLNGLNLEIDGYAPGSSDGGNTAGEIVVIKPNTAWANMVAQSVELIPDIANGWISVTDEWAFSSADGPSYKATVPSDATASYTPGVKVKLDQSVPLTASYNFDANSNDQKNGFNGTDTSMSYTSGKFGNAATFNGTTSKIVIPDNSSLKPTGAFTIGCWIKTSNTGATKHIFQSYSANTNNAGIVLYINDSNNVGLLIGDNTGPSNYYNYSGSTNVCDNAWHYVIVAYQNNFLRAYVDGKPEFSGYTVAPAYAATNYVRIGASNASGTDSQLMNGQIDDLFLVNGWAAGEAWVKSRFVANSAQGSSDIAATSYFINTVTEPTVMTLFGGTDYSLLNADITNIYYSRDKAPQNFPLNPAKWTQSLGDSNNRIQSSPVASTVYNPGSLAISVPPGVWDLGYEASLVAHKSASTTTQSNASLSTSSSSITDPDFTSYIRSDGASGEMLLITTVSRRKRIELSAKATYYLVCKTDQASSAEVGFAGLNNPTSIRAVCALL